MFLTLRRVFARPPRHAATCAMLGVWLALPASAGAQQALAAMRGYEPWLAAVRSHAPGQRDGAATRISEWSLDELNDVLGPLGRRDRDEQLAIVGRALVLHVDIALAHRTASGYTLPPGKSSISLFQDGRVVGSMSGTFHWEFARRLIARAPRGEDRLRIGRLFYRATAAVLQRWGEYPELDQHLKEGLDLLSDDPVLLMYEGALRHAFAGPRVQEYFNDQRRIAADGMVTMGPPGQNPNMYIRSGSQMSLGPPPLPSISVSLYQAERLFRRAIAGDESLAEARIRLAHVLADRLDPIAALSELEKMRGTDLPPLLEYYASLVRGRAARAANRLDEARTAFERAASIATSASAPLYGLSDVALAQGRRAESLSYLLKAGAELRDEANEPWWWIDRAHVPDGNEQIDQLRRELAP